MTITGIIERSRAECSEALLVLRACRWRLVAYCAFALAFAASLVLRGKVAFGRDYVAGFGPVDLPVGLGVAALVFAASLVIHYIAVAYGDKICLSGKQGAGGLPSLVRKRHWLVLTAVLFLCWLAYLPLYLPGLTSTDSLEQIAQILGEAPASNHHPYYHTLLIALFLLPFQAATGDYTPGITAYVLVQMAFMAASFGYVLFYFAQIGVRRAFRYPLLAFLAVNPVIATFSFTIWKDIPFSCVLMLLTLMLYKFVRTGSPCKDSQPRQNRQTCHPEFAASPEFAGGKAQDQDLPFLTAEGKARNLKKQGRRLGPKPAMTKQRACTQSAAAGTTIGVAQLARLCALLLALCLLRSNGIYIALATALALGIIYRHLWKRLLPSFSAVLVAFMLLTGPVFTLMRVAPPAFTEAVGIPLQQIGYASRYGEVSDEDNAYLSEKLMPVEKIAEVYDQHISNPIKFSAEVMANRDELESDKLGFLSAYLRIGISNPEQYFKGYILQTIGLWRVGMNPCTVGNYYYPETMSDVFGIETVSARESLDAFSIGLTGLPVLSCFFDIALLVWMTLLLAAVLTAQRRSRLLLVLVPRSP